MMLNNFGGANTVYNNHGQENSKDTSQSIESSKQTGTASSWGYSTQLEGIYNGNLGCYPGNHQGMYSVDQYKTNSKYSIQQDYGRYPQYSSGTLHHPIPVKCSEMCCQHVSEATRYPLNPPPSFQFSSHHTQPPPPRYTDYPSHAPKHYAYKQREKSISCNSNYPQMHSDYQVTKYPHSVNVRQKEIKESKALIESHCPVYPVGNAYWTTNGWMPPPPPYHQSVALQYKNNQIQENRVPKPIPCPPFQNVDQTSQERKGVIMNGTSNSASLNIKATDYQSHSFRTECFEFPSPFMTCSFSTNNNRIPSMSSNNSSSMHQSSVSSNFNSSSSNSNVGSSHCQIIDKQHAQINANAYSQPQESVVQNRVIPNSNCRRIVAGSANHFISSNDNQVYSDNRTSISPEDTSTTGKGSECSQKDIAQKKRPQLDVRQFLATWDDDEEDRASTLDGNSSTPLSATTAPVIVLDCRNIGEHEIRRVRDKLDSWENLQTQANTRRDLIDKHIVDKTIINNMIAKPVISNEKMNRDDCLSSESIMMCSNKKPVQNSYEPNLRNIKSSHLMAGNRPHNTFPETEHDPSHFNHHHRLLHHMPNVATRQQFSTSWDNSDVDKTPADGNTVLQNLETHQSTPIQPVFPHSIQHYGKKSNVSVVEPVHMISRNPTNFTLDPPELKDQSPLEHLVNFYGDPRRTENNSFNLMGIQDRCSDRLNNRIYAPKPLITNSNPIQTEHIQSFDSPPGEIFCETTSILKLVDNGRANIISKSIKPNSIEFTEDGNVLETLKTNESSNHGSYCQSIIQNPQAVLNKKVESSKIYTDLDTNKTLILNLTQRTEQNHCMPVISNLNSCGSTTSPCSSTTSPISEQSPSLQKSAVTDCNNMTSIHNEILTTITAVANQPGESIAEIPPLCHDLQTCNKNKTEISVTDCNNMTSIHNEILTTITAVANQPGESIAEIPPLCHDLQTCNKNKTEISCSLTGNRLLEVDQEKMCEKNDTSITLHSIGECNLNSNSQLVPTIAPDVCVPPYDHQLRQLLTCEAVGRDKDGDTTITDEADDSIIVNSSFTNFEDELHSNKKKTLQTSNEESCRPLLENSNLFGKVIESNRDQFSMKAITPDELPLQFSNTVCSETSSDDTQELTNEAENKAHLLHMPSLEDEDLVHDSSLAVISVSDVDGTEVQLNTTNSSNIIPKQNDNFTSELSILSDCSNESKDDKDFNKKSASDSILDNQTVNDGCQLSSNTEFDNVKKCYSNSNDLDCHTDNSKTRAICNNRELISHDNVNCCLNDSSEELNRNSTNEAYSFNVSEDLSDENNENIVEENITAMNEISFSNNGSSSLVPSGATSSSHENNVIELLSCGEVDKVSSTNKIIDLNVDKIVSYRHKSAESFENLQRSPACEKINQLSSLNTCSLTGNIKCSDVSEISSEKLISNDDVFPKDLNSNCSVAQLSERENTTTDDSNKESECIEQDESIKTIRIIHNPCIKISCENDADETCKLNSSIPATRKTVISSDSIEILENCDEKSVLQNVRDEESCHNDKVRTSPAISHIEELVGVPQMPLKHSTSKKMQNSTICGKKEIERTVKSEGNHIEKLDEKYLKKQEIVAGAIFNSTSNCSSETDLDGVGEVVKSVSCSSLNYCDSFNEGRETNFYKNRTDKSSLIVRVFGKTSKNVKEEKKMNNSLAAEHNCDITSTKDIVFDLGNAPTISSINYPSEANLISKAEDCSISSMESKKESGTFKQLLGNDNTDSLDESTVEIEKNQEINILKSTQSKLVDAEVVNSREFHNLSPDQSVDEIRAENEVMNSETEINNNETDGGALSSQRSTSPELNHVENADLLNPDNFDETNSLNENSLEFSRNPQHYKNKIDLLASAAMMAAEIRDISDITNCYDKHESSLGKERNCVDSSDMNRHLNDDIREPAHQLDTEVSNQIMSSVCNGVEYSRVSRIQHVEKDKDCNLKFPKNLEGQCDLFLSCETSVEIQTNSPERKTYLKGLEALSAAVEKSIIDQDIRDRVISNSNRKKSLSKFQIRKKFKQSKSTIRNKYIMKRVSSTYRKKRYVSRFKNNLKANRRYEMRNPPKDLVYSENISKEDSMNKENYPSNSFEIESRKQSYEADSEIPLQVDQENLAIPNVLSSEDVRNKESTSNSKEDIIVYSPSLKNYSCPLEIVCPDQEIQLNCKTSEDQSSLSSSSSSSSNSSTSSSSNSGSSSNCSSAEEEICSPKELKQNDELFRSDGSHAITPNSENSSYKGSNEPVVEIAQIFNNTLPKQIKSDQQIKSIKFNSKSNHTFYKRLFSLKNLIRLSNISKRMINFKENKEKWLKSKFYNNIKNRNRSRTSSSYFYKSRRMILRGKEMNNSHFQFNENDSNNNLSPSSNAENKIVENDTIYSSNDRVEYFEDPFVSDIYHPVREIQEQQSFPITELVVESENCAESCWPSQGIEADNLEECNVEENSYDSTDDCEQKDALSITNLSETSAKLSGHFEESDSDSESDSDLSDIGPPVCDINYYQNKMSFAGLDNADNIAIVVEEVCNLEAQEEEMFHHDNEECTYFEGSDHQEEVCESENTSSNNFHGSSFFNNSIDELSVTEVELSYCGEPAKKGESIVGASPQCLEIKNKEFSSPGSSHSEGYSSDDSISSLSSSSSSVLLKSHKKESSGDRCDKDSLKVGQIGVISISPLNGKLQVESCAPDMRLELKCSLPWKKVFNTLKTRKRKSKKRNSKPKKSGIELGPANVEFRIDNNFREKTAASWKVVRNPLTSPVIRVERLILQRDPDLTSLSEDSTSPKSEDSSEEELVKAKKRSRKSPNLQESFSSSEENVIPKVLIKKMKKSELYKSFLKLPGVNLPIVSLHRTNLLDELALREYKTVDLKTISIGRFFDCKFYSWKQARRKAQVSSIDPEIASYNSHPVENSDFVDKDKGSINSSASPKNDGFCDDDSSSFRSSVSSVISYRSESAENVFRTSDEVEQVNDEIILSTNNVFNSISVLSDHSDSDNDQQRRHSSDCESFEQTSAERGQKRPLEDGELSESMSVAKRSPKSISDHLFHCQRCLLIFNNKEEVMQHQAQRHPSHRELHHCMLCWRSFDTQSAHAAHMRGRSHRRLELVQRCTIHAMHRHFTGADCPRLYPLTPAELRSMNWRPSQPGCIHFYHHPSPLQLALQDNPWTSSSRLSDEEAQSPTSQSPPSSPIRDFSTPLTLNPPPPASPSSSTSSSSSLSTPLLSPDSCHSEPRPVDVIDDTVDNAAIDNITN